MPIKKEFRDNKDVIQKLNDAWIDHHLTIDNLKIENPLIWPEEFNEFPEKYISWMLSRPEYFYFLCKEIFNVTLLPTQAIILNELWNRKFPMFVASRGFGKTWCLALYALIRLLLLPNRKVVVAGAAFRQSKFVFEYLMGIWNNAPLLRDIAEASGKRVGPSISPDQYRFHLNGGTATFCPIGTGEKIRGERAHDLICDEFNCLRSNTLCQTDSGLIKIKDIFDHDFLINNIKIRDGHGNFVRPKRFIKTPKPVNVYKVITKSGYSFCCSDKHKVMTNDGFKLAKDLTNKDWLPLYEDSYFSDSYLKSEYILDEKMGWFIGILVSEGSINHDSTISISNTDFTLIEEISSFLTEYNIKHSIDNRESYIDDRGWNCKESKVVRIHNKRFREWLKDIGLERSTSHNKDIPNGILQSPQSVATSFLKGLFTGDGSIFNFKDEYGIRCGIAYYSVSEELIDKIQILLLKLGIICNKQKRKSKISKNPQWMLRLNGQYINKFIDICSFEEWIPYLEGVIVSKEKLPRCRIHKNKWLSLSYFCGTDKYLGMFDTKEEALKTSEDFNFNNQFYFKVKSVTKLEDKEILYDFEIDTTNSFIANSFLQHNSQNKEIFETVLVGFTSVHANPVGNVQYNSMVKRARKLKIWDEEDQEDEFNKSNQLVLSGTAGYSFQHFAEYHQDWHDIIMSRGDPKRLSNFLARRSESSGQDAQDIMKNLNWKDYSIIRIPYELIPEGFMDEGQIARSKATMHSGTYGCEYGAVFSDDSNGFFSRRLVESCVAKADNMSIIQSYLGGIESFSAKLIGEPGKRYIYGIDPASEVDNFAIIILEIHNNHHRIVYSWTTNKGQHQEEIKSGLINELDFYSYCAKKIRWLKKRFPAERLMMDAQGGGNAVMEALYDPDKIPEHELAILPVIDEDKEYITDDMIGEHIVELVQFADANWTSAANNNMKKDLEDKVLLFPNYNPAILASATAKDKIKGHSLLDNIEDCVLEIEELKDELSTIVMTRTPAGRDKFDTPEQKLAGGRKGRMRKDRYSALVMANMGARLLVRDFKFTPNVDLGGFAAATGEIGDSSGPMYSEQSELGRQLNDLYG